MPLNMPTIKDIVIISPNPEHRQAVREIFTGKDGMSILEVEQFVLTDTILDFLKSAKNPFAVIHAGKDSVKMEIYLDGSNALEEMQSVFVH